MARTAWPTLNQVSGQSAYVAELVTAVESIMETIKPLIEQKKYLRNLFDKASSLVLTKFTNTMVKSRPLQDIGAEQLLIDLQTVKACLLKLPGDSLTTSSYTRSLTKSTTRLEALLKVIVTPVDPPDGFILNYTLLIGDASFSNFQKVAELCRRNFKFSTLLIYAHGILDLGLERHPFTRTRQPSRLILDHHEHQKRTRKYLVSVVS